MPHSWRRRSSAAALVRRHALGGSAVAIYLKSPGEFYLTNNLLVGNAGQGGIVDLAGPGVLEESQRLLANNTLAGNGSTAVAASGWLTQPIQLANNIIVSHTVGVSVTDASLLDVRYTRWHGNGRDVSEGVTQTEGITAPPAFTNPDGGDYSLLPGSAAINAGDPAGTPPAPPVDITNFPRPFGPRVDIGAYEWHGPQTYFPLITAHGT